MYDGFFQYDDTEILNTQRTVAYAKHMGAGWVKNPERSDVADIAPLLGDDPYDTPLQDTPPWFDPDDPDTWHFYGLLPIEITGLDDSTRTAAITEGTSDGGTVGRIRNQTRSAVFHVLLLGDSDAACNAGFEWLKYALLGQCGSTSAATNCGGAELEFLSALPDVDPADPNYPAGCIPDYWRCLYKTTFVDGPHILSKHSISAGSGAYWEVEFTSSSGAPAVFGIEQPVMAGMFKTGSTAQVADRTNLCTNPNFQTGITGWQSTGTPGTSIAQAIGGVSSGGSNVLYDRYGNPVILPDPTRSMQCVWQRSPNLVTGDSATFEGGTVGGWTGAAVTGTAPTLTNSTLHPQSAGTKCLQVAWANATGPTANLTVTGLVVGNSYVASVWVFVPAGSPDVRLGISGMTPGSATSVKNIYTRIQVGFTATATSHQLQLSTTVATSPGLLAFLDNTDVSLAPLLPGVYFNLPTIIGHTYTVTGRVKVPSGSLPVQWIALQHGLFASNGVFSTLYDVWDTIYLTFTAIGTNHWIELSYGSAVALGGETVYLDNVLIEDSSVGGTYFDGSSSSCRWLGAVNGSQSQHLVTVSTAPINPAGGRFDDHGSQLTDVPCPVPTFTPINDPTCITVVPPPPAPVVAAACFAPPKSWIRYAAEIPANLVPAWRHVVPVITLTAQGESRWVRLRFFADTDNDFDVGGMDPCAFIGEFLVTYLPDQAVLTIDGARQTVRIVTGAIDRNASQLVFSSSGGPFSWPEMSCGYSYIMTIDCPPAVHAPAVDLTVLTKAA
jgi:hypothetical protein